HRALHSFPTRRSSDLFAFAEPSVDKAAASGAVSVFEVPDDAREVRKLLAERVSTIGGLVRKGAFSEVWVPAFQAKDLAIALDIRSEEHTSELQSQSNL